MADTDATGGDIRALCDLSGISVASACRSTTRLGRVANPRTVTDNWVCRAAGQQLNRPWEFRHDDHYRCWRATYRK